MHICPQEVARQSGCEWEYWFDFNQILKIENGKVVGFIFSQTWLSLKPWSWNIRWARTLKSIQKPQDHYSI